MSRRKQGQSNREQSNRQDEMNLHHIRLIVNPEGLRGHGVICPLVRHTGVVTMRAGSIVGALELARHIESNGTPESELGSRRTSVGSAADFYERKKQLTGRGVLMYEFQDSRGSRIVPTGAC